MTTTTEEYAHSIYRRVAQDYEIESFLHQTDTFNPESRRWAIPPSGTINGLVDAATQVLWTIVSRFVRSTGAGVTRTVTTLNPDSLPEAQKNDQAGSAPSPIVVIRASGPSFEEPPTTTVWPSKSFSNGPEMGSVKEVVQEMEPYARRIFEQQPNRLFVRCLLLTENHARLVHFDRAGVETTPLIDIHQHPDTFVRIITGLASVDERTLGLDDSIQWTIVNGRKEKGTLTTTNPSGALKTYPILEHIPIPRDTIAGRGTNCWRVRDPDSLDELVVKDSWRPDYMVAEHELLELAHDIPGVVQMVSYETGRGETKDFRCPNTAGKCHNRVAARTMMKSYGKSIDFFTSALQVLCAIRDAIAGHQRLVSDDLKILHRDISHNNILIGPDGAPEGVRGVLIDLDAAFKATNGLPNVTADFNIGTRIFQSLCVLSTYDIPGLLPAHDYLDDLESFFYVLAYTFLVHLPNGSRASSQDEGPSIVSRWDNPNASIAWRHKSRIFSGRDGLIAAKVVERTWGPICSSLFTKFGDWMSDMRHEKLAVHRQRGTEEANEDDSDDDEDEASDGEEEHRAVDSDPFTLFYSRRDAHYAYVLGLFDEAINKFRSSATHPPSATAPVASSTSNSAGSGGTGPGDAPVRGRVPSSDHHIPDPPPPAAQDMEVEQEPPLNITPHAPTLIDNPLSPLVRPPSPLQCVIQPRRSARIRVLRQKHNEDSTTTRPSPVRTIQPRRSARTTKRHREEDEHIDVPRVKRTKKSPTTVNGVH
ncbi:hypothetical protein FA13DRAFT_1744490 [Coprinellus micaceus]|uniref:Fungal-type protein kinase domain-containing protein n=1 Tax=Coprinellus micaceus TaxID=71717 RepID=A0A4Y7SCN3_COPMI|nr:hypothetical protein FA13DRAFT_1744490 [Coprinellus micaceus]